MIKDISKLDLETIDLCIEVCDKMLAKLPSLSIPDDAKEAWVHEINENKTRVQGIRLAYTDGATTAKHPRDTVVMLCHCTLTQRFLELLPKDETPVA